MVRQLNDWLLTEAPANVDRDGVVSVFTNPQAAASLVSADETTMTLAVNITGEPAEDPYAETIEAIRAKADELEAAGGPGFRMEVSGPGGLLKDLIEVFSSIDGFPAHRDGDPDSRFADSHLPLADRCLRPADHRGLGVFTLLRDRRPRRRPIRSLDQRSGERHHDRAPVRRRYRLLSVHLLPLPRGVGAGRGQARGDAARDARALARRSPPRRVRSSSPRWRSCSPSCARQARSVRSSRSRSGPCSSPP